MGKVICLECGTSDQYEMRKVVRKYEGEGYSFELEVEIPFCTKCGKQLVCEEIEEEIAQRANEIIRKQRNIITKDEILKILEKYNTSQKFLSKLLGWGDITLTRYISGNYTPNQENSERLKALLNPYVFQKLLNDKYEETQGVIKEEKSFEKAQSKVNYELQKNEQENGKIFLVINWFLSQASEELPMTHLALQKLLYFAQSWSIALTGEWIFEDECQAWAHGAVYPQIYEIFKYFGYRPLPQVHVDEVLSEENLKILNLVKNYYYDVYNAKTLERVCHLETPYGEARAGFLEEQWCQEVIDKDKIRTYYTELVEKYNISLDDTSGVKTYLNEILG